MCFAVIRGKLFAEQLRYDTTSAVIVDDDQTAPPTPVNHFYEDATPYLLTGMLLAAIATELGAGLALYKAWKMSSHNIEDRETIQNRLVAVNDRLLALTREITARRKAPALFDAKLQASFYYAMLTHTMRNALGKGLLVISILGLLIGHRAYAQNHASFVVAVDLTKSVDVRSPTGKTEFQENIGAVTKLLSEVPAGSHVKVIGITDRTFTEPYVLLSATVPGDPGYFGEKLRRAHLAAELFNADQGAGRKVLVIFSDMRQHTSDLDLETNVPHFAKVSPRIIVPDLNGVDLFVLGVDGSGRTTDYWDALKLFWSDYSQAAKARLQSCSGLRDAGVGHQ
jgi:hypothetical protein